MSLQIMFKDAEACQGKTHTHRALKCLSMDILFLCCHLIYLDCIFLRN